ncbi:MAG: hypothetical protein INQ03_16550 [Candidatus Heimdallarchaeota archaeon]|nr:hypothetical protein [Candidatus Heimdallarchaeota archaeon]
MLEGLNKEDIENLYYDLISKYQAKKIEERTKMYNEMIAKLEVSDVNKYKYKGDELISISGDIETLLCHVWIWKNDHYVYSYSTNYSDVEKRKIVNFKLSDHEVQEFRNQLEREKKWDEGERDYQVLKEITDAGYSEKLYSIIRHNSFTMNDIMYMYWLDKITKGLSTSIFKKHIKIITIVSDICDVEDEFTEFSEFFEIEDYSGMSFKQVFNEILDFVRKITDDIKWRYNIIEMIDEEYEDNNSRP